jgi:hypothetical protein
VRVDRILERPNRGDVVNFERLFCIFSGDTTPLTSVVVTLESGTARRDPAGRVVL